MARSLVAILLSACALVVPRPAEATYTTVAMERATGRYGVVVASCVQLSAVRRVYASVPEHGAVVTQSYLVAGDSSQALALELLGLAAHAAEVVEAMIDPQFDIDASLRQYVVLDGYGEFAGFSGIRAEPFAGHIDASNERFSVGIAGNFLTGGGVLEAAALGFQDETACDLEERLLNALRAPSQGGLGDARCVMEGRPAESVWLHVAGASGRADLDISVDAVPGIDPIGQVISRFSEWRSGHPCPVAPEMSSAPSNDPPGGCAIAQGGRGSAVEVWPYLLVCLARRRRRAALTLAFACARQR